MTCVETSLQGPLFCTITITIINEWLDYSDRKQSLEDGAGEEGRGGTVNLLEAMGSY